MGTILNDDQPLVLLLEENTQRAAALEVTTLLRDPFPLVRAFNFGPDLRTRISLFALNLTLIAGEDASAVTVSAEDDFGSVQMLQVESVSVYVGLIPRPVPICFRRPYITALDFLFMSLFVIDPPVVQGISPPRGRGDRH